jgi:hypothetical protein
MNKIPDIKIINAKQAKTYNQFKNSGILFIFTHFIL